eukprot:5324112-Amphidinium_carterae.1
MFFANLLTYPKLPGCWGVSQEQYNSQWVQQSSAPSTRPDLVDSLLFAVLLLLIFQVVYTF